MSFTEDDIAPFTAFEISGWDRAAKAYHDHWSWLSSQSAGALLRVARVGPGAQVLDVATGAGYVAALAQTQGAEATGLDFSQAQVALARQSFPDVEFRQGDAQQLPFETGSFDAVVMGFGMNHLPRPEAAVAEAFRVLRPGGVFAFTVWATPAPGQGFGIVLSALDRYGAAEVQLPAAPPYFRFADPEEVRAVLSEAGFGNITTEIVPQAWHHQSPDQVFDAFNEGAVRATAMLQAQPEEVRAVIRDAVRAEVMQLCDGEDYVIPVPAALSAGTKPA